MNILLYPNLDKENGLLCTWELAGRICDLGGVPMLDAAFRETVVDERCTYGKFTEMLPRCDAIIPIGGDGTILRAARHAVVSGKPLVGVNAGRVGFLTQLERHELEHLRRLFEGDYTVGHRMMLEAELTQGEKRRRYSGLNDIVISRGDADRIVDIDVYKDSLHIARHRADGLIFATPTGSTAYSLSAGGPIVDPGMTLLLMTTICSHSTWNRSVVLPTDCNYTITDRSANNPKGLVVAVDGRRIGKIQGDAALLIRKSAARVPFIDLGLRSFYQNVNEKLSWGR